MADYGTVQQGSISESDNRCKIIYMVF
jgi:hypothetical protein